MFAVIYSLVRVIGLNFYRFSISYDKIFIVAPAGEFLNHSSTQSLRTTANLPRTGMFNKCTCLVE